MGGWLGAECVQDGISNSYLIFYLPSIYIRNLWFWVYMPYMQPVMPPKFYEIMHMVNIICDWLCENRSYCPWQQI